MNPVTVNPGGSGRSRQARAQRGYLKGKQTFYTYISNRAKPKSGAEGFDWFVENPKKPTTFGSKHKVSGRQISRKKSRFISNFEAKHPIVKDLKIKNKK